MRSFWPDKSNLPMPRRRGEKEPERAPAPKWQELNRAGRRLVLRSYGLGGARRRGGVAVDSGTLVRQRQARAGMAVRLAALDKESDAK